jgi:hypothetical protein
MALPKSLKPDMVVTLKIGVWRKAGCDCSAGSQVVLHGAALLQLLALAPPRAWVRCRLWRRPV